MNKLYVHTENLSKDDLERIEKIIDKPLSKQPGFYLAAEVTVEKEILSRLSHELKIDINLVPAHFNPENIKLVISDMDSTLISIECIDEIADFAGLKPEVSKITESAMRGEIDFPESLRQRVWLLKGLTTDVLDKVYQERLKLNPGAENLINGLRKKAIKFALVSGGFTFFTSRLANRLNIDYSKANVLGATDSILDGSVVGEIVDGAVKRDFLLKICEDSAISLNQAIAVGDGANDLKMMNIAGLSVAYRAKEIVQQHTDVQINYGGLDLILDFLA